MIHRTNQKMEPYKEAIQLYLIVSMGWLLRPVSIALAILMATIPKEIVKNTEKDIIIQLPGRSSFSLFCFLPFDNT